MYVCMHHACGGLRLMLCVLCDCSVPYILKQGLPPDSELVYLASLASEIRGSPSFPPICCDNKHALPPNIHGSAEDLNCSPHACVTSVSSLLYPRSHQSQQPFLLKMTSDICKHSLCVPVCISTTFEAGAGEEGLCVSDFT